jgi:hypothetical protein
VETRVLLLRLKLESRWVAFTNGIRRWKVRVRVCIRGIICCVGV